MQTIRVRQIMTDEYGRLAQTDVNMRLVPVDFLLLGCPLESIEIVPSTRSSSHRYKDLYSQL